MRDGILMISWASLYLASKTVPDLMVCPVKPRSKGEHIRNVYKPSEVLRSDQEPAEPFTPHPLFRNEDAALDMGQQQF